MTRFVQRMVIPLTRAQLEGESLRTLRTLAFRYGLPGHEGQPRLALIEALLAWQPPPEGPYATTA